MNFIYVAHFNKQRSLNAYAAGTVTGLSICSIRSVSHITDDAHTYVTCDDAQEVMSNRDVPFLLCLLYYKSFLSVETSES